MVRVSRVSRISEVNVSMVKVMVRDLDLDKIAAMSIKR